jgi:hypothetical protein
MALDPYAELPAMKDALAGTEFEGDVDCIVRVLEENKIKTVDQLDNSPRYLTCSICGQSLHKIIELVRAYMEGVKDGSISVKKEKAPEADPEPEKEEVVEEKLKEPEPKKEPEKSSRSRSRSSRRSKKE